jgi:hypothetical protein
MTPEVETLYPRIGQRLLDAAGEPFVRGYARVEMADDYGSVGLFVDRGDGGWRYLADDSGDLYELFGELRERCIAAGLGAWSQATFALQRDGRFSIEFGHDDISDLGAAPSRREAWVRRVLGPQASVRWS